MNTETIPILYQDHHLLIVNKPAGLVIHPTYKHANGTMWDALLEYLAAHGSDDWQPPELPDEPEWAGAPMLIQAMLRAKRTERQWKEDGLLARPCLLHRLDKDTSGIVALARTEQSRRHIIRQFHNHTIVKRYLAVIQKGAPAWSQPCAMLSVTKEGRNNNHSAFYPGDEFIIDGPLQRDPDDRRRCIIGPEGQQATTFLKVLALSDNNELALLEVQPLTGRTHQIRAHLAAWGYAIVGDPVYALPTQDGTPQAALKRQFLHASSLEFQRYPDNQRATFVAPLADELISWMTRYFPTGLGVIDANCTIST
ncbi:MAG: RluA family pseudouridine synthase [Ktedonobacteraceae bacterium]